jgi:hypothetical protein
MKMRKSLMAVFVAVLLWGQGFALTNGPSQPEFSSFEPVDATDLVNLPTGDFSYVLPLGKVRTPDGTGYPVVLNYHGGIQNDQEATWVGLGWSLNVGSINRQVRNVPDDYDSYSIISQMYLTGERGWSLEVGVGWGPISASVGFSCKAGGGVTFEGLSSFSMGLPLGPVSIGMSLSQGGMSVGANINFASVSVGAGMSVTSEGKVSGSVNGGLSAGGYSVAGFSLSSNGQTNVSVAGQSMPFAQSFSSEGMHQWSSGFSIYLPLPSMFSLSLGFQEWGWYYNLKRYEKMRGYLFKSVYTAKEVVCDDTCINYCMKSNFAGYNYRTSPSGVYPDYDSVRKNDRGEKVEYSALGRFNVPANDVYSISGQGISGTFMPISSTWSQGVHSELDDQDFDGIIGQPEGTDKPLTYSSYFNDAPTSFSYDLKDGIVFKAIDEQGSNLIDGYSPYNSIASYASYDGWNNYDNIGSSTYSSGSYGSYQGPTCGKKIIPLFGLTGSRVLNGFAVTDQEGKTYYYTLPLYSLYQTTYCNMAPEPPALQAGYNPDERYATDMNYRRLVHPYATSWLLTAVTGPDYIKMVDVGGAAGPIPRLMPHQGDWGYWVKFDYEYGLPVKTETSTDLPVIKECLPSNYASIEKAIYGWRLPYYDENSPKPYPHQVDPYADPGNSKAQKYSSMYGLKEMTYLKSIETASEVAFFRTSERYDGYGIDYNDITKLGTTPLQYEWEIKNADNGINWEQGHQERSDRYCAIRWSHPVQRLDEITNPDRSFDLDKCTQIVVNNVEFPMGLYTNAHDGDELFQIKYKAHIDKRHDGFFSSTTMSGDPEMVLSIIKDSYGCTFAGDPPQPTALSSDKNPSLSYYTATYTGSGYTGKIYFTGAKCIYARAKEGKMTFYIIAYPNTGLHKDVCYEGHPGYWHLIDGSSVYPPDLTLAGNTMMSFFDPTRYYRYAKKLDEIAWYSKAEYPYLTGEDDPQDPWIKGAPFWAEHPAFPFPKSYRRMKFRYNYELAKGTPNSRSDGMLNSGGRLTLKEVYEQAGPEDNPVNMPSYLFDYQSKDTGYTGFQMVDPWGARDPGGSSGYHYASTHDDETKVGMEGVQWNLNRITLPSCGRIEVEYERDRARSSWLTLAEINREYECSSSSERGAVKDNLYFKGPLRSGDPSASSTGFDGSKLYTHEFEITAIADSNKPVITLVPGSGAFSEFERGMLAIVFFEVERAGGVYGTTYRKQATYLYRIMDLDPSRNTITLDKPVAFPWGGGAQWYSYRATIVGINKKSDICDGVRVTNIRTRSLSGVATTNYSYPLDGVIETAPEDAIPPFMKTKWSTLKCPGESDQVLKAYSAQLYKNGSTDETGMSKHNGGVPPDKQDPINPETNASYGKYVKNDIVNFYCYIQGFNTIGQSIKFAVKKSENDCYLHILYLTTDPSKADAQLTVTVSGYPSVNVTLPSTLDLPDRRIGDVTVPLGSIVINQTGLNVSLDFAGGPSGDLQILGLWKEVMKWNDYFITYEPIYSTGNSGVIYPTVEVQQSLPDGRPLTGKTRYNYYTFDDLIKVNDTVQPVITSTFIKNIKPGYTTTIWKINDRSGIVGLAKSIEQIRTDGSGQELEVVGSTVKEYAFSEDLYRSGMGVLSGQNSRLGSNKPLGLIRERAIRRNINSMNDVNSGLIEPATITDLVRSKPFLVAVTDRTDRAPKKTSFGLFDALTGKAMATLVTGTTPITSTNPSGMQTRLDVNVPYRLLLDPYKTAEKNVLDVMKEKNQYGLAGGSYVSDNNNQLTIPDNINGFSGSQIKSSDCKDYKLTTISSTEAPFTQSRLAMSASYAWKGSQTPGYTWSWPQLQSQAQQTGWIAKSRIDSVDRYSRPLTELTPGNALAVYTPSAAIHHPRTDAVVAAISNARSEECAAYTCDYEDYTGAGSSTGKTYFDSLNGWKVVVQPVAGVSALELVSMPDTVSQTLIIPKHFGNKALHLKNHKGLTKTVRVLTGKDYCVSAWVYPEISGSTITFSITLYDGNGVQVASLDQTQTGLVENEWQRIRFVIDKAEILANGTMEIAVGNTTQAGNDFYIDDIRFYPNDALMTTFYYDYNIVKPVTFVDANDKALYYRYDVFGRLVEKGIIKDVAGQ